MKALNLKYTLAIVMFMLFTGFLTGIFSIVYAFQGDSASYTSDNKQGYFAQTESTSTTFAQRVIASIEAVGQYIFGLFTGRFGILEDEEVNVFYISNCTNLTVSNSVYILTLDVLSTGTCFNIKANKVTLNCSGHLINYSKTTNGYGIASVNYNDSIVRDCKMSQASATRTNSYAIYFQNGTNATIENNSITTYGSITSNSVNHGIYFNKYKSGSINNNIINTSGYGSYSIYLLQQSNSSLILNNSIKTSATSAYGIYLLGSSIGVISGNNITTAGSSAYPVYLFNSSNNNFTSNKILSLGTSGYGIYSYMKSYSNIFSTNIINTTNTSAYGIALSLYGIGNSILNNSIVTSGTSAYGVYLTGGINSTIIDSNNILINGIGTNYAIRFNNYNYYNNITNSNLTALTAGGIGISYSLSGNSFIVNNTVASFSLAIQMSSSGSNFISNNIFNSTGSIASFSNSASYLNYLNKTKTLTTNIIGRNYIGGNYWVNSLGTGRSQTCGDPDGDSICNQTYVINNYNIDYLPLTTQDSTPPDIYIYSPSNNSFVNGPVIIRANGSDNHGLGVAHFQYKNSTVTSWTNISTCINRISSANIYSCTWNTASFSNLSEGYDIRIMAYDNSGNSNFDTIHYIIDRTKPIVIDMQVVYPIGQSSVKNNQGVNLTATVTDSPFVAAGINYVQAYLINLNGSLWTNMTFSSGSMAPLFNSSWNILANISTASSGIKYANISVNDAATPTNNNRKGDLWAVQIDNIAPTYSGLYSTGGVYNNTFAHFGVLANDNFNLSRFIFSSNPNGVWQNDSPVAIGGTSYLVDYSKRVYTGTYSYKFYLYDDAGNIAETSTGSIEVLGNPPEPTIYLVSPENNLISNNPSQNFVYYYTGPQVDSCSLIINGISEDTVISPANGTYQTVSKTLSDNNYDWFVSCIYTLNLGDESITTEYFSDPNFLIIDTTFPLLNIISPLNDSYGPSLIEFNVSGSENLDSCKFSLNLMTNITMNRFNETYFYSTYPILASGSNNVVFTCNDSANNINFTSVFFSTKYPSVSINFTYPENGIELVRGNSLVTGEDDMGIVAKSVNLTARVYNETNQGVAGATCYFYNNNSFITTAYTNDSGHCSYSYSKSSLSAGTNSLLVNYTLPSQYYSKAINESYTNFSIVRYITSLTMVNLRAFGGYYDGDNATLLINITKINETGTFVYDPQNISANSTNSAQQPYGPTYYPEKGIIKLVNGSYRANVTVNKSFGGFIRWEVTLSNDNYGTYIGSAIHADKEVCTPSYSAWSAWSACSGSVQTRSRTDGCGGTEVETQSCTDVPTSCFPAGTKILMSDGNEKNIEDVKVGEDILSYNEKNKINDIGRVEEIETPVRNHMCSLVFSDNSKLELTKEHPVYTNEGWKAISSKETLKENSAMGFVSDLIVGDYVMFDDLKYKEIKSINCWNEVIQTYNLKSIDKYHNFYANNVLVHNKGEGGCTSSWSAWSAWSDCVNNQQTRTRSDGCGSTETEFRACGCTPLWEYGVWNICEGGVHSRIWTDRNRCDETNLTYTETQSCIKNLIITYTPQELFLIIANGSSIEFSVTMVDSVSEPLTIKWYLDSTLRKQDSGTDSLQSFSTERFLKDSKIKAEISNGLNIQEVLWDVKVSSNLTLCEENWYCTWSVCKEPGFKYAEDCVDLNECGTNLNKPYQQECSCIPDFKCGENSLCEFNYSVTDVLQGKPVLSGQQFSLCSDAKKCENNTVNYSSCDVGTPVRIVNSKICYEDYVEVYDIASNKLVSRLKSSQVSGLKKLDIGLITSSFAGYCNFCFDGIKDFDETDVDCGGSCAPCIIKKAYFDWLYYLKLILWISLLILVVYAIIKHRKEIIEKISGIKGMKLKKIKLPQFKARREIERAVKPARPGIGIEERIGRVAGSAVGKIKKFFSGIEVKIRFRKVRRERAVRIEKPTVIKPIEMPAVKPRRKMFASMSDKLKEWKQKKYYGVSKLEEGMIASMAKKVKKIPRKIKEYRIKRAVAKAEKKIIRAREKAQKKLIREKARAERKAIRAKVKARKKFVRVERKAARRKAREIKRKIRRKEVKKEELGDLEKQLREWKEKGYYDTTRLQKKLDEFKGRNPLKG
ncbi:MAG: NosD domain-containing protein [Candidatus Pacearchaeota archaeon]|jgi:hypothetical protein